MTNKSELANEETYLSSLDHLVPENPPKTTVFNSMILILFTT
jgi:hypothetical protein